MKKMRVAVLFGGKSAEHEVSLQSAKNIVEAMDKDKYDVVLIGIDKRGHWRLNRASEFLLHAHDPKLIALNRGETGVAFIPGKTDDQIMTLGGDESVGAIDVAFPVLHGPFGEDGSVQGMLKLAGIPFVGTGIIGSAACMDKDVMKRLLRDAGIPVARWRVLHKFAPGRPVFAEVAADLGVPFFVKPANLGSSVGISKVKDETQYAAALAEAFRFDLKVLLEEAVPGREIECSVLGCDDPVASVPGEVVTNHEFYSYEAKYIDEHGAALYIPADLPADVTERIRETAVQAFRASGCDGMARVDFFLRPDGNILVNELNTIPGFTRISMYPKLWEASGISYTDLIDGLISLAVERHVREQGLETSR